MKIIMTMVMKRMMVSIFLMEVIITSASYLRTAKKVQKLKSYYPCVHMCVRVFVFEGVIERRVVKSSHPKIMAHFTA